jgi:uncharacterized membrane protein YidH (DUF202 family)
MKPTDEIKTQAMNAFTCAETVAHVGMIKLTGGIALYAARIRQMDRQAARPRQVRRDAVGREV